MKGKYLITTDNWFLAPDGQEYKSVWGEVQVLEDSFLGIKTNRNSVNWFLKVGSEENHVIVAGCQVHYAARSENKPNTKGTKVWSLDARDYKEETVPTKIYIAE